MGKISLKGVIDMHVHSAPDIRQRRYTDIELMQAAVKAGARAVVIKSHHGTTMNRAFLVNEFSKMQGHGDTGFTMIGSITLNKAVGGLNPVAVDTALKMGAKVVWLPTMDSANEAAQKGKTGGIECVVGGKIVDALKEILKIIKDNDVVLGTAHLSPKEIFVVVEAAKAMGIEKIVVTHPEWPTVNMSHEDQIKITKDYGVYLEKCYAHALGGGEYKKNLPDNLEVIKEVGYKNVLISTDGGQVENANWELALAEYLQYLSDNGIPDDQIVTMSQTLPAWLLNLK